MTDQINEIYGNRVRLRTCGLLVKDECLLMVNHYSLSKGDFWAPPGGGVHFRERAQEGLKREFLEETGLNVTIGDHLFTCEFIRDPLHAVELFFKVDLVDGVMHTGHDPELAATDQIIQDVRFLPWTVLQGLNKETLHGAFGLIHRPADILQLNGYHTI
jgi:8-oxo-dGTP diphosphatase